MYDYSRTAASLPWYIEHEKAHSLALAAASSIQPGVVDTGMIRFGSIEGWWSSGGGRFRCYYQIGAGALTYPELNFEKDSIDAMQKYAAVFVATLKKLGNRQYIL